MNCEASLAMRYWFWYTSQPSGATILPSLLAQSLQVPDSIAKTPSVARVLVAATIYLVSPLYIISKLFWFDFHKNHQTCSEVLCCTCSFRGPFHGGAQGPGLGPPMPLTSSTICHSSPVHSTGASNQPEDASSVPRTLSVTGVRQRNVATCEIIYCRSSDLERQARLNSTNPAFGFTHTRCQLYKNI